MTHRIAVILCDVLSDEVRASLAKTTGVVHTVTLEQGLHNTPPTLRSELQIAVDRIETDCPDVTAIVLGYGLCSRGVEEVSTRRCLLVLPRAHDCITLLLGSKETYGKYVADHPGTYWYSPGWNRCHTPPGPERHAKLLDRYRQQYGEEDAQFLMESEQAWFKTYSRATYVHLGSGSIEQDLRYTKDCADWLGWQFDLQQGDPQLLIDLLRGNWDEERFLVLQPGQAAQMTADERIVTAIKIIRKPT